MGPSSTAASRLCTACGMCCNGVLFHLVRLQAADSVAELEALGVKLRRKKHEPYFTQPCAFLLDCHCTIYAQRPQRCRAFNCQQIQKVAQAEITEAEALVLIEAALSRVRRIEAVLCQLPDDPGQLSLTERYTHFMASNADEMAKQQLTLKMRRLSKVLNEHFRIQAFDLIPP